MAEAFEGADIVIPKSWAPFAAMEKRTNLYAEGDDAGIAALEKELLAQNATHQDWCSTTELMEKTANGQDTIFMHPLPADISGVSCEHGEVNADVFDMPPRGHVQGGQLQAVRHRCHDVPAEGCRSRRYPQGPRRAQHRPLAPGLKPG